MMTETATVRRKSFSPLGLSGRTMERYARGPGPAAAAARLSPPRTKDM